MRISRGGWSVFKAISLQLSAKNKENVGWALPTNFLFYG
jgi:hypothetical protein